MPLTVQVEMLEPVAKMAEVVHYVLLLQLACPDILHFMLTAEVVAVVVVREPHQHTQ